jgi:hypothetical protein
MPPVDLLDELPRDSELRKSGGKRRRGRQDQTISLELVEVSRLRW